MWRTLEELNADHERLVAEVEALKKQFEKHVHRVHGKSVPNAEFPQYNEWATSEPMK